MNNKNQFITRFKKNKRGLISFIILSSIFFISLFAEIIANDKPIFIWYKGKIYLPIIKEVSEKEFGGDLLSNADFRDPVVLNLIKNDGWMIMPLIAYNFDTINLMSKSPAPAKPNLDNLLGTDDQGRDVLSRTIYGIRISLIFALFLTFFSTLIAISLGAIQGYFGGLIDILLQRFTEIWSSLPVVFLLIIFSAIIAPNFFTLLILMMFFSWMPLASMVRAEFLRLRNFEFVKASKALGASSTRIIFNHILPNASPIIIANLPFLMASSLTALTTLDFLGFGLPVGTASLGELLSQGKNNIQAYWLGIVSFMSIAIILSTLLFIGEALRDGFDVKKIKL